MAVPHNTEHGREIFLQVTVPQEGVSAFVTQAVEDENGIVVIELQPVAIGAFVCEYFSNPKSRRFDPRVKYDGDTADKVRGYGRPDSTNPNWVVTEGLGITAAYTHDHTQFVHDFYFHIHDGNRQRPATKELNTYRGKVALGGNLDALNNESLAEVLGMGTEFDTSLKVWQRNRSEPYSTEASPLRLELPTLGPAH